MRRICAIVIALLGMTALFGCASQDQTSIQSEERSVYETDAVNRYFEIVEECSEALGQSPDDISAHKDYFRSLSSEAEELSEKLAALENEFPEASDFLSKASSAASSTSHVATAAYEAAVAYEAEDWNKLDECSEDLSKYTQIFTMYANGANEIMESDLK